ncbi:MAG: hypothetical protein RLZZ344_1411 [Pseudomonadota bacterium]|jgi:UDP-3-O-[3-hydroxymyristoyl] glucosamine N-acyltransferase
MSPGLQPQNSLTAGDLVARLGGLVEGNAQFPVLRFQPLDRAGAQDASFLAHDRYLPMLRTSGAGLLVVPPRAAAEAAHAPARIVVESPYLFFAQAAQLLVQHARQQAVTQTQVDQTAVVHPTATVGARVRIGALAVIEAGVVIGEDTDIGPGVSLGVGAAIGAGGQIHAGARIGADIRIGARVVIHSGAVIGSDGFGFAPTPDGTWVKIPQVGNVRIGDDVEIGANTVIDRGTLADTVIGNGVKLDNLIQIAHNVEIGDHTAIAGCVGIAGSARIGRHCQIGGAAGILGHLSIADHTVIGPMSLVMSSITEPGKYVGVYPLQPERDWEKSAVMVRRLPSLRKQFR